MSGKVAIVTGSNKGIGLAIVRHLCQKFQGIVYLTSRDEERGQGAVAELEKLGFHPRYYPLDIDNLESIKKFRAYLEAAHGGIDVLINNAAMAYKNAATESFGVQAEHTLRVNFFGTLNVCRELFPLLRKHGRVVHMSSYAGHLLKISGEEPGATELRKRFSAPDATEETICQLANEFVKLAQEEKHYAAGWPNSTYVVSKVAVSALVPIQQRSFDERRAGDDLVVNSVNPGYVDTDMTSHKGMMSVDQGAEAPLWLALLPPNTPSPRGLYVWNDKRIIDWVNGPAPLPY